MPDDTQRDLAALDRERLEADRRYNDALTAVDRAIVRPAAVPPPVPPAVVALPPVPRGWRGRLIRAVAEWLAPIVDEQRAFNARIAAEIDAASTRALDHAAALEQFQTALIVFLQQITAFVDTKIRVAEATVSARLDEGDRRLATMAELRAQVETLQRIVQSLKRRTSSAGGAENSRESADDTRSTSSASSALKSGASNAGDLAYVGFEDRFRGSADEIREKQSAYLPIFAGASEVLDIGCGRGEFLDLLRSNGVTARGVDLNAEMVAVARDRGLDAHAAGALEYVSSLTDESLGGVMCAQVIEHLEPSYLIRLLETLSRKLRAGAPLVMETINPACWLAFFSSYIRDFTHVRPIHPETLEYLLHASGFGRVSIRYSAPVPDSVKMAPIALPAPLVSSPDPAARALVDATQVVNANSAILNNLMFTYLDYAAIAHRS